MARSAFAKTNLNAGEFSPRLLGRTDIDKYFNGVARMKNFLPLPFGGASFLPGTMFVNEVRDSSKPARILDWVFGSRQAYILQLNDSKIRFYKDKGTVYGASVITVTGITNANPGVVTANSHGFSNGDNVVLNGIDGMLEVNGVEYTVANVTANTFELSGINTTSYGTFIPRTATVLLLHLDNNLTDSSPSGNTVTAQGQAAGSATWSKFGGYSYVFDGVTDALISADDADWDFGTGDFCIDFWWKPSVVNDDVSFIDRANSGHYQLVYSHSGGQLRWFAGGASIKAETFVPVAGTEYYITVFRNGTNLYMAVNGALLGSATTNSTDLTYVSGIYLGSNTSSGQSLNGYLEEFRITKGYSRYTGAHTVPTAPSVIDDSTTVSRIYEIAHEFLDADLFEIQTAQNGDIMYMAHGDHPPQKLSRLGEASWTIADTNFLDGPYLDENTTATTLDPDDVTGNVTITASAITGINGGTGFQTTDVGRLIRWHDGTNYGWLKITARTSTTVVDADVIGVNNVSGASFAGHAATAKWALGAWSDTTGWPAAVGFFQGRLWFGGTTTEPQKVWGSQPLDFENMGPGTAADGDAINYQLVSSTVNIIKWLAATKRLVVGTEGENFTIYSGTSNEPVTPTNVKVDSETNYGASGVAPVKVGSYLYYVQDDETTFRELYYDFAIDAYRSVNRSILSEHLTRAGVVQMAYQKAPFGVVWCVLSDGKIATFTREIEQEVAGWADQTPRSGDYYESVAAIPVDGYTEMWFVVKRTINGQTKRYVEYQVSPNQTVDEDLEDMVFMQSALSYTGGAISTATGLSHLEGAAVAILADGTPKTGTVSSGAVSLGGSYTTVHVGLPLTGQIKLLPLEAGSQLGSAQGLMKKIGAVVMRVYRSLGLTVGEDGGNMDELFVDGNGAALTTVQTDDFDVPSTLGWDTKQQLLIEQADPLPATVLMIVLNEYTSDEKT